MQSTPEMKAPSRLVDLIRTMPEGAKNSCFAFRSDYSTARWSYKKVFDLSLRFSSLLEDHGIGRGDRVIIRGDNTLPFLVAFLGVLNRGAVLVPLDGTVTRDTALLIIKKVQARLIVSSNNNGKVSGDTPFIDLETLEGRLDGYPVKPFDNSPVYESDLAEIVFTSGTTAEPKGVMIRHSNITSLFPPILDAINRVRPVIRALRNINFLALLPLSHLYGQMAEIFVPLMVKGSVIFSQKLSPSFLLETIKRDKINIAVAVPKILEIIRLHIINDINRRGKERSFWKKYERSADRHFILRFLYFFGIHRRMGLRFLAMTVGGARLDPEVHEFYRRLSFAVYQGYGLTETSPIVTIFDPLRDKPGSVGKAVGNQQIRIADDGEILVRGANVTDGYFEDQDSTEKAFREGWLRTGDIGSIEEDGSLWFLGRKKDRIVGLDGLNIYPEEIERVLNSMPGVKDSAVIGAERAGREEIVTALLLRPGVDSGEEIIRKANATLPPPKRIKQFYIWPELDFPRTPSLKIKKREVAGRIMSLKAETHPPVKNALAGAISRLSNVDVGALSPSLRLGLDLGLSSLDRMELALSLENDYHISIQDSLLGEETSIKDLEDILSGKEVREKDISMPHFGNYPVFTLLRFASWHIILFPFLRIFCRHKVKGIENLQGLNPPVIFIANHSSHVDTPLILRALPYRFRCRLSPAMGIDPFREYFSPSGYHPYSHLFQFVGYMALVIFAHVYPFSPVSFRKSFAYTGRLVEKSYCPLIFPEGRRTKTGEMERFMEGIGHLALGIRAPVIPLRLRGTFDILPPDASFPKRGEASVHIGKPYLVKGGDPETVTDELKRIIEKL